MKDSPKTLTEIRKQLGFAAMLIAIGALWFSYVLYGGKPDQILPTSGDVQAAYGAVSELVKSSPWSLETVAALALKVIVLLVIDILFVVARYGGVTLCFLGAFAIFDAISSAPREGRR